MAQNIELITLGSKKLANETSECIPVAHKNMLTVDQLHDYYRQIPDSNFFAVLVFDSSNSILMLILTGIERRKDQLIGIFICANSDDTLNYTTTNIYHISKTLIAYKINSTISRFLECECIKQFERYRLESGMALEEQRRHLMKHLGTNKQFKACHILLIPLNTTPKALHTAKQRLKNICYDLYGREYTFRIHTLYNYIPEDESNSENSNYEDYLKRYYGDDICCSIMDLSVMVFCLVGNLSTIDNQWSQKLIASHVDTDENRLAEYFGKLTFIIDQPVPNQYYQDLLPRFGATWQIPSTIPTLLNNLKDDIYFQTVLQSISGILENREMAANYKIKQRSLNISNHMVAFEIEPKVIILANIDTFESFEILLPIPLLIVYNEHSLITKISNRSNQLNSSLQRFFIICLKTIETDEDEIFNKIEENPEVLTVFHIWNDESMPIFKYTKAYYIQKELITIAVTCKTIEFLKNEADIQTKLNQLTLTKLYMRKAEKIKEWLMSNMRAEPCHILLIPLNTNVSNLLGCIQYLKQHCTSLGYPSTSIRILDEYIPKSELYDKLPYGKTIFEYEHPEVICAWLRDLSPIRMYLYGNEQLVASEWSKQMILYEADHIGREIVNDDDWHTFIENDAIDDDIKWNFYANHAQTWKIKRMTPIKVCNLNENLRFRSALRRAHITYHTRRSTVTAQIYHWFDQCSQFNYIPHEFQLQRHNRLTPRLKNTNAVQISIPLSEFNDNVQLKLSPSIYEKDKTHYSLPYLFNQTCEYIAYNSSLYDQTYIWLDDVLYSIEERFHGVIHPNQWIHFTKVNECQEFIQNQQLQYNSNIYLIAKDSLAEQLFTFDHISRISSAYIYSNQDNLFIKWIRSFQVIRGVYANFDELYDKLCVDMVRSMKRNSCPYQEQVFSKRFRSLIFKYIDNLFYFLGI
ncbi:hypothetical protein I4U23_029850 [Adineta vaga]|nr:hypothetical protein I4U23_029850 [Adineta vaga]